MSAPSRRAVLAGTASLAAVTPAVASVPAIHPDADLVKLCEEHLVNLRAVLATSGRGAVELDGDCPEWQVYLATAEMIDAAEPQTMVGVLAKARAALTDGVPDQDFDGYWDAGGLTCHAWAFDLLHDLARIHGIEIEDPRSEAAS